MKAAARYGILARLRVCLFWLAAALCGRILKIFYGFPAMSVFMGMEFSEPAATLEARTAGELARALNRAERYAAGGKYCLGYILYEAWKSFCGIETRMPEEPLLYMEVFGSFRPFVPRARPEISAALVPLVSKEEYFFAVGKIKDALMDGETYEVNYSYPSDLLAEFPDDFALFEALLPRQNAAYSAFISNRWRTVLSFSPELFFRVSGRRITAKPMKGTAARLPDPRADARRAAELSSDPKNRAENLMIVDLMRNDLSRVCEPGSVEVEKMFEVESLPTVHQMTSTVSATLSRGVGLADIFRNIFPCGSVTGAPKLSTMRIIESLEAGERGVYCGAILLVSPEETVCSVPIRILQRRAGERFRFHSGSAVVWDSSAGEEWAETLEKARFINGEFEIIETFLVENGEPKFLREHLARMENSARELGFAFDASKAARALAGARDGILRLSLSRGGSFSAAWRELSAPADFGVEIARERLDSRNPFLRHKTSKRGWYARASRRIAAGEVYDEIFLNERGEVCEGSRCNVVIEKGGVLYTPPLSCGLLDGVMRRAMLPRLAEKVLRAEDLFSADRIYMANSVRGTVEVFLREKNSAGPREPDGGGASGCAD